MGYGGCSVFCLSVAREPIGVVCVCGVWLTANVTRHSFTRPDTRHSTGPKVSVPDTGDCQFYSGILPKMENCTGQRFLQRDAEITEDKRSLLSHCVVALLLSLSLRLLLQP